MDTYELKVALAAVYRDWEVATRPGYYAYQSSMGKRKAVLYSAMQTYLPQLEKLEAEIPAWADTEGVPGKREQEMWHRAARIRRAIVNADPDDVTALFPV